MVQRILIFIVLIHLVPIPSLDTQSGYDPPIRTRRYCLSCEDPNHFNKRNGLHDEHPSMQPYFDEDRPGLLTRENITSMLKSIDEFGERLGIFGPEAPQADWEKSGEWIGNREEWTPEALGEHLAATAELDEEDPETWVKLDAPIRDPDMSAQVLCLLIFVSFIQSCSELMSLPRNRRFCAVRSLPGRSGTGRRHFLAVPDFVCRV
jgi:hypothetical protein